MDKLKFGDIFHSATVRWLNTAFPSPTPCQKDAWPNIKAGKHTLIAAPTGAGKTLAAFLSVIDDLVQIGQQQGYLEDQCYTIYISPLKALSNDIDKNLQQPLAGIEAELEALGLPSLGIRTAVRSGDTPQTERTRMRRTPPHILVTTPESFYLLLTSDSGRAMLSTVRNVIVDEIHALASNKRGAHLSLSLERLQALLPQPLTRIGLSATQKPIERVAKFLVGEQAAACEIVDTGYVRQRDLALELPLSPLTSVMAGEVWGEVYNRLAELARSHRTTLLFVNTRRLAERAARHLSERFDNDGLGADKVASHHGSLAKEHRLEVEQKLKQGDLNILVATASLELGIDIGDVDLVCQIGSPRSIAALLQRVGRSGHSVGGTPKGRMFPTTRDELVECVALLDAVRRDELDELHLPQKPLDVLAQQLTAEVAAREWDMAELFQLVTHSYIYRDLSRSEFDQCIRMLAEGFATQRGRRSAYLHLDAVNGIVRGRRGARLTALTNGGAIPEQFDYDVILEPEGVFIGSLNEDFAFESLAGDIFQLGNTSYRILRVENGKVRVEDAKGQPPNIPFWFGEAPGRSNELSFAVSRLRREFNDKLNVSMDEAHQWLEQTLQLPAVAREQLLEYLGAAAIALGRLPTQENIVFERFFDEAGDMHLVIHSPYGSRLNRAWGLALRKRFCRRFNFELQAAALEDSIVLSLGPTHSFPLEEVKKYLHSNSVRQTLIQALLDAPMFATRWRWVANIALAVKRNRNGKRIPAQLQRTSAEDLIAVVFPDQLACQENITGAREVPDHPLVNQAIADCLHEVMDIDGLETVLQRLEKGDIDIAVRELNAPSPLAQEILSARPYAFLDDAPAEERRTLAVQARGMTDLSDAASLAGLDPAAITQVGEEISPDPRNADELHDVLVVNAYLLGQQVQSSAMQTWMQKLVDDKRATQFVIDDTHILWVAAERLAQMRVVHPRAELIPVIDSAGDIDTHAHSRKECLTEMVRDRMESLGPIVATQLVAELCVSENEIQQALLALESEGVIVQGYFSSLAAKTEKDQLQWCERRVLARIHRYTISKLRKEIEPVAPADLMRFLLRWQKLTPDTQGDGTDALLGIFQQLEGFEAPVAAWESEVLPARLWGYTPSMLDELSFSGRVQWARLSPLKSASATNSATASKPSRVTPVRMTPLAFVMRQNWQLWRTLLPTIDAKHMTLSSPANAVDNLLKQEGALFFEELTEATRLLPSQVEQALAELVAIGRVNSDSFNGIRALLVPSGKRRPFSGAAIRPRGKRSHRAARVSSRSVEFAGRWSVLKRKTSSAAGDGREVVSSVDRSQQVEDIAMILLRRYGVIFRALLEREPDWLPPWRDLVRALRRLEAQGHIRGGRFVTLFSGEQFALPEAVGALRETRRRSGNDEFIVVNAADPMNLVGIVSPGKKVPALPSNKILFRDGVCVAVQIGDKVELREAVDGINEWNARYALMRRQIPEVKTLNYSHQN